MKKIIQKDYYVMDERLSNKQMDQFGHKNIADNILNLIKNKKYKAPYNIALIGKWGLGKSSILKLVEEEIKQDSSQNIKMITINAWKYEKESLKKVYLKKIYEEVLETKIDLKKQLEEKLINFISKTIKTENITTEKNKKNEIWIFLILFLVSFVLSFIWQLSHYISNGNNINMLFDNNILFLVSRYLNFYFKKILFTLVMPLVVLYIPKLFERQNNVFPIPISYEEDYESLLKKAIEKKNKTFVIVIDDLDRLSTKKMVESLDTLKTLMEIEKCIFIVPFDDSLLKNAIDQQVVSKIDSEHQIIESEFILDKLFQFRFYVPPLILSDMKDYTLKIIKEESRDLYSCFAENELEEIVRKVFIYEELRTARQIKKIINTFSNNIILMKERIKDGRINSNFFDKTGKLMIAKISVLQSDFNDFYDDLFENNFACEELIKINRGKYNNYNDIPRILQKYCETRKNGEDSLVVIKPKYNRLVSFLSRTSYIKSDDIAIYLYCNQDKTSLIFGSEFRRKLINSMRNLNFTLMNDIIKENKSENINSLLSELLEIETMDNLPNLILSILNIKDINFENYEFNKNIIDAINKVNNSGEKFELEYVNLNNLISIKETNKRSLEIINMANNYYKFLILKIDDTNIDHNEIFYSTIKNINYLYDLDIKNIKDYLMLLVQTSFDCIKIVNTYIEDEIILERYFGLEFCEYIYEKLEDYEEDDDDHESYDTYSNLFVKLYNSLKNKEQNNEKINNLVINLMNVERNIELCEHIIINNKQIFTAKQQQQILENIIMLSDENLTKQHSIINNITYELHDEIKQKYQDKIIKFIEQNYNMETIMGNLKSYSEIDSVIQILNKKIYNNSNFDVIYKNNIEKFTKEQLDHLEKTLSEQINEETYMEGRITSVFNIVGDYVYFDNILCKFTEDQLIKSKPASNEIIKIINNEDSISDLNKVDNYIKRKIELLPIESSQLNDIKNLSKKVSENNYHLFNVTMNDSIIEKMSKEQLEILFHIYLDFNQIYPDKNFLKSNLNKLLDTDIESEVISYMTSESIDIQDGYKFIFNRLSNVKKLKEYKKLKTIITIDDEFTKKMISSFQKIEFTSEQLSYLVTINKDFLHVIQRIELSYKSDEEKLILNIQKIFNEFCEESELALFQSELIKNGEDELLIKILEKFELVNRNDNKRKIREALKEKLEKVSDSSLISEKLISYAKKLKFNIKTLIKEKAVQ